MPTITSAQTGLFSATTTWVGGVVPVDADLFFIATGHTVTYDVATPVTNGFGDSNIYGILQSQSGVSTVLRMNGRLNINTAGTYHARAGHKLQFRGTAAESHILYLVEAAGAGASLIMEGSDGMPTTTLSANANERSTIFSFTSATNFAIGEWFAVYDNTTAQAAVAGATTLRDEGFWVHDISGTTVYFRQYVGPDSTISSSNGTTITVANSKVFRVGQQIIFGTTAGTNLNVKTISAINYTTHVITCGSAISGTVTGLTVYETGTDKIHTIGNKVRKCATITSVSSASAATTITVANANMFVANDEIWIEARSECGGTTDRAYNAYGTDAGPRYKHDILSVTSNTITLKAAIGYNVVAGALVTRLTRDVIVEPITPNVDYYGVWVGYYDAANDYSRKLILKDVQFRYNGSSFGQLEGGVTIRGQLSTNALPVTLTNTIPALSNQPWIEGITLTGSNSTRDWGGLWSFNSRYCQFRCCAVIGSYNSSYGLYYNSGTAAYNCIAAGSNLYSYRVEGVTEWGECSYNYSSRSSWGMRIINYDANCGVHHNIIDALTQGPYFSSTNNIPLYKFKVTGNVFGPACERSNAFFLYSKLRSCSGYSNVFDAAPGTYQRGYYHDQGDRGESGAFMLSSIEDDFEYDRTRQYSYGCERWWDLTENAWRCVNAVDFDETDRGFFTTVFVPANVTLRTSCAIKLVPTWSGTYPYFLVRDTQSGVGSNRLGNAGGNWSSQQAGGGLAVSYTIGAVAGYETQTWTVPAQPFPRQLTIGVANTYRDGSEGWWMKPIQVLLDQPYANPAMEVVNHGSGQQFERYAVGNSSLQSIIRIGGRI